MHYKLKQHKFISISAAWNFRMSVFLKFNKLTSVFLCVCPLIDDKLRQTGQIPGINRVFERQVWHVQVAHLHKATRVQVRFFKFYPSVLSMLKTSQSAREKLDSYCKIHLYIYNQFLIQMMIRQKVENENSVCSLGVKSVQSVYRSFQPKQPRSQGFSHPTHLQGKSPGSEVAAQN